MEVGAGAVFFGKMRKGGGNPSRTRSKNDERKKRGTSIGNLLGVILNYLKKSLGRIEEAHVK